MRLHVCSLSYVFHSLEGTYTKVTSYHALYFIFIRTIIQETVHIVNCHAMYLYLRIEKNP